MCEDTLLRSVQDIIRDHRDESGEAVFFRLDSMSGDLPHFFIRTVCAMLNTMGGYVISCFEEHAGVGTDRLDEICKAMENELAVRIVPEYAPGDVRIIPVREDDIDYVAVAVGPGSLMPYATLESRDPPSYGIFSLQGGKVVPMKFNEAVSLARSGSAEGMRSYSVIRCRAIGAGDSYIPLIKSAKIVVHIFPEDAFCGGAVKCTSQEFEGHEWVQEHVSALTGELLYYSDLSYIHVGGHGEVEAVDAMKLRPKRNGKKAFYIADYQKDLSDLLSRCSRCYADYAGKLYMGIALVGANGYELQLKVPRKTFTVESDVFMLPLLPVVFEKNFTKDMLTAQVNRHLEMIWGKSGY